MIEYRIKSKHGFINILEGCNIYNPKAIILHIHGLGSHFQFVYDSLDEIDKRDNYFSKFNYKTFGFEFYGHGKSDGTRCFINDFNDLLIDLNNVIIFLENRFKKIKIFLCAESMGGAVVLKYIVNNINCDSISGIILLSPMCGIDDHLKPSPFMLNMLLIASNIIPTLKFKLGSGNVHTSRNKKYTQAKFLSPYTYRGPHNLATIRELYNISMWIPDNCGHIQKPLLLFHGLNDTVTTPSGSINMFYSIGSNYKHKNNELILIENAEHCLLIPNSVDDLTPNYIYNKILSWIEKTN
jgi:alpha-beta hydrolase superfamily lysophospholipase